MTPQRFFRILLATVAIAILLPVSAMAVSPSSISDIRKKGTTYQVYNYRGRAVSSFPVSRGELMGFADKYYILRSGDEYHVYDNRHRKYKTLPADSISEVTGVTPAAFFIRRGNITEAYSPQGKLLSTRHSRELECKDTILGFLPTAVQKRRFFTNFVSQR